MRQPETEQENGAMTGAHTEALTQTEREVARHARMMHRIWVHIITFVVSFVFTTGASVLVILLWVQPGGILGLVFTGLFASAVFVCTFAYVRFTVLHRLSNDYDDPEEDPGTEHHLTKSVTYGCIALVIALVLVGILASVAGATSF